MDNTQYSPDELIEKGYALRYANGAIRYTAAGFDAGGGRPGSYVVKPDYFVAPAPGEAKLRRAKEEIARQKAQAERELLLSGLEKLLDR